MIEAILNIPKSILESQKNYRYIKNSDKGYVIILLDDNLNIEKIEKGTFEEVCSKNNLTDLQKDLIKKFDYYRGIEEFGPKDFNRYCIGGKNSLATCSLLHYEFSKEGKIADSIISKKERKYLDNLLKGLNSPKKKYSKLLKEYSDMITQLKNCIQNLFENYILKEKEDDRYKNKIVIIPNNQEFIKNYNEFHKRFIKIQSNKQEDRICFSFPYDNFGSDQTRELGVLYSKLGKKKVVYQDRFNLFKKEDFEKLDLFKKILNQQKIIPLPLFKADSNIYQICFSNEKSLLEKLKEIYERTNKPVDYCLMSDFGGFRFENIINWDFNIEPLIDKQVYQLNFNKYKNKKEELVYYQESKNPDKYELLADIYFLFYDKGELEEKLLFDYNKKEKIKNNPYLNQIFIENSDSIVEQIYKQNNNFINFKLQKVILKILKGIFIKKELRKRYKDVKQIKRLLLISLKYDPLKMKSKEIKRIEEKLEEFKRNQKLDEIISDTEGYVYAGIIIKHLLSNISSGKTPLEIMTKYILSVNNSKQLKDKIIFLTKKYSYNLNVNDQMWKVINKRLLEYEFEDTSLKSNLIPFFIGFYMDFWISKEK